MATDMQPVFSGFPNRPASTLQDARDRQPPVQGAEPSRNFESMLGRAEARYTPSKQEVPPVRNGDKTGINARPQTRSTPQPSGQSSERSTVSDTHEQNTHRTERSQEKAPQSADGSTAEETTQKSTKKENDQNALQQDMILAAMMAPAAAAPTVEMQPVQGETGTKPAEDGVEATAAISMQSGARESALATTQTIPAPPGDMPAEGLPAAEASASAEAAKDATQSKEETGKDAGQTGEKETPSIAGKIPIPESRPADRAEGVAEARIEPDHVNSTLAARTATKQEPTIIEQGPVDHLDRSMVLDALAQGTSLSESQGGSDADRFMEQNGQSLPDSSGGTDRSLSHQTSSIEQNDRPVFLDRMNGFAQPAPSATESSSGRGESGQTAAVLRASGSERVSDLQAAGPISHSVTLDLDPLDMGPLRVRVMMSEQTVHAHIRTEHGELGQGLLQQGQSLESSLRTTGLEMGMLRVTVDQQQGRGDNAWMFQQQQQQGRPPSPNMSQPATREDERAARGEHPVRSNERVSFFA